MVRDLPLRPSLDICLEKVEQIWELELPTAEYPDELIGDYLKRAEENKATGAVVQAQINNAEA